MTVVVPNWVKENLDREALVSEAADHERRVKEWNQLLRSHDERLDVVWVQENADDEWGRVIPGRWHVRRRNDPPEMDGYFPITREDGGYREFSYGDLERLRMADLRNPEVARRFFGVKERKEAEKARRRAEISAERRDRIATAYKAVYSPGVLIPRGVTRG